MTPRSQVKLAVVAVTGRDFRFYEHLAAVHRTVSTLRGLGFSGAYGQVYSNRSASLATRLLFPEIAVRSVLTRTFNRDRYSRAVLRGVSQSLAGIDQADFALFVQWDGFAKNPWGWDDRFLKYDYVGASWENRWVGNGGFSLRSRRFLEWCAYQLPECPEGANEDWWACVTNRRAASFDGIRFAPVWLARRFSVETVGSGADLHRAFGFHSEARLRQLRLGGFWRGHLADCLRRALGAGAA